ncbi:hypothetical protein P167DRAFT_528082 [Morchella conica CCBAS932]|uniref:RlpA-like protein double-psi beta-barrel domain-containing protein n=1 Tax=Morchella conica CCBAS932 TaxID=1392247 RepID=A0A3N4KE54_9PEZI|nr:hypothetical protein P167DRAFT_528082 [Morchella conica CCBAS932]
MHILPTPDTKSEIDQPPSEQESIKRRSAGVFAGFPAWFRQHLPLDKDRTYFGLRRNVFLLVLLGAALALLALILGLAIGLTAGKHGKSKSYIPNPSNKALNTGEATYYAPGLGACGITSTDTEAIVAVSHVVFDAVQVGSNPNANPLCGTKVWATRVREETGKNVSVVATVVDRCTGCKPGDLDFSLGLFEQLAAKELGRVMISWSWL